MGPCSKTSDVTWDPVVRLLKTLKSPITPGTDFSWLVYFYRAKSLIKSGAFSTTSNASRNLRSEVSGSPITPGLDFSWLVYFYRANPPIKCGAFSTTSNAGPNVTCDPVVRLL